jgi:hypothetical protein
VTGRRVGVALQAALLAVGLVAGWLWLASVTGSDLVFRYQGF